MADLRIADAPEIALEDITGNEKVPTGGYGNSAVTINNLGQFAKTALSLATEQYVSNAVGQKENKITLTGINLTPSSTYSDIPQTNNTVLNIIHQDLLNRMEWIKDNVAVVTDHQALSNRNTFNTHPSTSISHNGTSNVSIEIEELKNDVLTINTETIPELQNDIIGKQDVIVNDINLTESSVFSDVPSTNNSALNNSLQALVNRDKFIDDNIKTGLIPEFDQAFADAIGGYPLNARLMLDNGDIVRSTISNNTNNPNSDMTGWENTNNVSASNIFDDSGETQQNINDKLLGDNGASYVNISFSEISNSVKKSLYDVIYDQIIDVTWFGAIGDWNKDTQTGTNSTLAVQNAVAYLSTLGTRRQGGKRGLKFPKGSFRVDKFTLPTSLGFGLDIIGDGPKTTNIYFDQTSTSPAITSEIEFVQFRNLSLIGALDEVWNTTRTPLYKGRLPDGRADIDVAYVNCEIVYWNIASQIHGRGCSYEACSLGLVISGMDIVVEDYTHGPDSDLMQSKYATMRHYNYRNCRFDNCSRAYTVSGSGEMIDFINNGVFIGNDITNMDLLIEAPTAQLVNWCIGGNVALGSFATSALKTKAFHMTSIFSNNFTKSTNYTEIPTSNSNSMEFFVDVSAPCSNLTINGNTIRGIRGAFYRNTSASPSKNVSIYGNNLPEFGAYKGGNSSINFMLNTSNHVNLLIKDNSFSCSNVFGSFYLFNSIGAQLAKDVIYKDNTAPFAWSDRIFSNSPTVYVGSTATTGTSTIKTHQYNTDGDYVVGNLYFSGTIPETSGAISVSLPVAAISLNSNFGSIPSGVARIITASGLSSSGYVFSDSLVNSSTQRIDLRKQKDMTLSSIDASDVPDTLTLSIEYRYRFK